MLTASAQFDVEVEGNSQVLAVEVEIDLPGGQTLTLASAGPTPAVSKLDVEAQMTTSQPDQSTLTTGYPSAQLTFTLAGQVDYAGTLYSAADLFGPWNTASPLYRQHVSQSPVRLSLGLHPDGSQGVPELVRKFTGVVDSYQCNADGTVDFTCIDLRTTLRSVPAIPAVVTVPPFNAGLTSEFALDALLRAGSGGAISSWPKQRPQCVLAVGFRSSLWPEVGTLDTSITQLTPTFDEGEWGSGLVSVDRAGTALSAATPYVLAQPVGDSVYFEFFIADGSAAVTPSISVRSADESVNITASIDTGPTIRVSVVAGGAPAHFLAGSVGAGVQKIGVLVHWPVGSTSVSGTGYVDGVQVGTGSTTANPRPATVIQSCDVVTAFTGTAATPLFGVQITNEAAPTVTAFTPTAILDLSLNPLQVVPAIDAGADPWQTIQSIVEAGLGFAGFDESGIFRSRNRQTLAAAAVAREITDATSLVSLSSTMSAATVVNRAQVGYTAWNFGAAGQVFALDTNSWRIAPGETRTFTVRLPGLVGAIDTAAAVLPNGHSTTDGSSWYRLSRDRAGTAEHTDATVTIASESATKLLVTCQNTGPHPAWFTSPANYTDIAVGTPSLWIGGIPVTATDEVTADYQYPTVDQGGAAGSRWGEVAWQYSGNPWLQDADTADQLCRDVVSALAIPRPVWAGVAVVPDPRLQLGDVVHLIDSTATGVDEYGVVEGWSITLDVGDDGSIEDYSETLDVRAVGAPGGWIAGIAGRSEAGTTTYAYA